MTYDRSKVTELITTTSRELQALIKERQIKVQLIVESFEKMKQSLPKETMKHKNKQRKNILKDNAVDSASEVFSFCVFV